MFCCTLLSPWLVHTYASFIPGVVGHAGHHLQVRAPEAGPLIALRWVRVLHVLRWALQLRVYTLPVVQKEADDSKPPLVDGVLLLGHGRSVVFSGEIPE
jgi:hypothetical protein